MSVRAAEDGALEGGRADGGPTIVNWESETRGATEIMCSRERGRVGIDEGEALVVAAVQAVDWLGTEKKINEATHARAFYADVLPPPASPMEFFVANNSAGLDRRYTALRMRNRVAWAYPHSLFFGLYVIPDPQRISRAGTPVEHVQLVDLFTMLGCFHAPSSIADRLDNVVEQVVEEWNMVNASPDRAGHRSQVAREYCLKHYAPAGRSSERTELVLKVDSFAATKRFQNLINRPVIINAEDISIALKFRSTLFTRDAR